MGDIAFMLRDYETAIAAYKLIATDFKNSKDSKLFAGTQELTAVCLVISNPIAGRKECESSMELAYTVLFHLLLGRVLSLSSFFFFC